MPWIKTIPFDVADEKLRRATRIVPGGECGAGAADGETAGIVASL